MTQNSSVKDHDHKKIAVQQLGYEALCGRCFRFCNSYSPI